MTIVKHPTLNIAYDVPAATVSRWVAAGWNTDGAPHSDSLVTVGDQGPVLAVVPDSTPDEKPRPVKRSKRK